MKFHPPRFSIVASAPSACLSFRTALLGRCFGYWLRSSSALGKSLRFLCLPLAAPCRSLSSRGLAFRFPLPAALPARPHACGHANIARYSLQRLCRPARTMGLRPIPWQEPEVPAPPSCRSMPFLEQQGPCVSLSSPCRPASSSACLRACEHCALQLTAALPPCKNDGAPPHTLAGT